MKVFKSGFPVKGVARSMKSSFVFRILHVSCKCQERHISLSETTHYLLIIL